MGRGLSLLTLLCGGLALGTGLLGADGKKAGCVPVPAEVLCEAPTNCEGLAHDDCVGAWTCTADAQCVWVCGGDPGCPLWAPPAPGWCEGGLVLDGGKDAQGCQLPPKCVADCKAAEALYDELVTAGKACSADSQCTQEVPVGLLCPCPRVLSAGADVDAIAAIAEWYLDACAPQDGWGCGGGCQVFDLYTCVAGKCS